MSAFARRIAAGRHAPGLAGSSDVDALRDEVDQLRTEVAQLRERSAELDDVQNRLDFAERLLAQVRDKTILPGGK